MPLSTTPVLVTGATGNVGRAVVRALLDASVAVRARATTPDVAHSQLGSSSPLLEAHTYD